MVVQEVGKETKRHRQAGGVFVGFAVKTRLLRVLQCCLVASTSVFVFSHERLHDLQEIYSILAEELKRLASAHGERLLHTPHNPISLGELNVLLLTRRSTLLFSFFFNPVFAPVCPSSSNVSRWPSSHQRQSSDSAGLHAVYPTSFWSQVCRVTLNEDGQGTLVIRQMDERETT